MKYGSVLLLLAALLQFGCQKDNAGKIVPPNAKAVPDDAVILFQDLADFLANTDPKEAAEISKRKFLYDQERKMYFLDLGWEVDCQRREVNWIRRIDDKGRPSLVDVAEYRRNFDGHYKFQWKSKNMTFSRPD